MMKKIQIITLLFIAISTSFVTCSAEYSGDYMQNINYTNPLTHTGTIKIEYQTQFEQFFWENYDNSALKSFMIFLAWLCLIFFIYIEFNTVINPRWKKY